MRMNGEPRPPVCRRLFAEDSSYYQGDSGAHADNLVNEINEENERDIDAMTAKYNFDFRTEQPLEGKWQWEPVNPTANPLPLDNQEEPPAENENSPTKDPPPAEEVPSEDHENQVPPETE